MIYDGNRIYQLNGKDKFEHASTFMAFIEAEERPPWPKAKSRVKKRGLFPIYII